MLKELAYRVQQIKPSATADMSSRADKLAASGRDIINLAMGEPDFNTPSHIQQAAIAAMQAGQTRYTATDGTLALKDAIIQKFARDNQLTFERSEIIVSCGAKHSLYNLFAAILNPGDEVIIAAPYWVSYPDMAKLMGANPVIIHADHKQQFKMTPVQLRSAITPATRLLVLNSPSNPTGVAYTAAEWQALGAVLMEHPDIIVVTDDIYEHNLWRTEPFSNILMVCPALRDRCVVVNGVSKTYAMTGWRIGYTAGPHTIIGAMKKIQSQSTSCPCSISQAAATAALNGDQACVAEMTAAYQVRHDYLVGELQKLPGVSVQPGDGTFYVFPHIEPWLKLRADINDDVALSEYVLNEVGVAVIPGSAFGAPGYIRISYAANMDKIVTAVERLQLAIVKLSQ